MNNIIFFRIKFLALLIPFLYSCQKAIESKENTNNNSIENFELFFKKFSSNPKFQLQRIEFPLKTYSYDIDSDAPSISSLDKKHWRFSKLYDNKYLKKVKKNDSKNYIVEIRVIDTGVLVEYYFKKEGDNKWYLIKIIDKST